MNPFDSNNKFVVRIQKILRDNLISGPLNNKQVLNNYYFISPNKKIYVNQFLYNSCLNIIVNSHIDRQSAIREFFTLISTHNKKTGYISCINFWLKRRGNEIKVTKTKNIKVKKENYLIQPPLLALALKKLYVKMKDRIPLKSNLEIISKFFDYIIKTRINDEDPVRLINIYTPLESGIFGSPIYDLLLRKKEIEHEYNLKRIIKSQINSGKLNLNDEDLEGSEISNRIGLKDLFFNCIFIQELRELAYLHGEIKDFKRKNRYEKTAMKLEKELINNCWNSSEKLFFGISGEINGTKNIKTVISFIPLILDNLPQNIAHKIVDEHLLNEDEFWTKYPIPSVAINESSYQLNPKYPRRGATNIDLNWFIINGLQKHGFINIAAELADKTLKMVDSYGFFDSYHPITGKRLGKKFSTSCIALDLIKGNDITNFDMNFLLDKEWTKIKRLPDF